MQNRLLMRSWRAHDLSGSGRRMSVLRSPTNFPCVDMPVSRASDISSSSSEMPCTPLFDCWLLYPEGPSTHTEGIYPQP